jgi:hypothetical protein
MKRIAGVSIVFLVSCQTCPEASETRFWFDFVFFHTAFDSEPGSAVAVNVTVAKEDPVAGLVWWRGVHVEGDRIGWKNELGGWTSLHWVWSDRLQKYWEVDFNSDAVIRSIRGDLESMYHYGICEIDTRRMKRTCLGIKYFTDSVRTHEATYVDPQGKLQVVRVPCERKPWWNAMCTLHGGQRPVDNAR